MSEQRFTLMLPNAIINDTIVRKSYYLSEKDDVEKLVDCLNEQQSEINSLKLELELRTGAKLFSRRVLERRVKEQQATIEELEKNFDDLVKWASEIAKRNVVLDEQIGQLQRENEQLRKDKEQLKERLRECGMRVDKLLGNCR